MAYYRQSQNPMFPTYFEVFYATASGAGFTNEGVYENGGTQTPGIATSIALTELGTPAVSYTRSSMIQYKIRTGGSWSSEVTVPGNGGPFSAMLWEGSRVAMIKFLVENDGRDFP